VRLALFKTKSSLCLQWEEWIKVGLSGEIAVSNILRRSKHVCHQLKFHLLVAYLIIWYFVMKAALKWPMTP